MEKTNKISEYILGFLIIMSLLLKISFSGTVLDIALTNIILIYVIVHDVRRFKGNSVGKKFSWFSIIAGILLLDNLISYIIIMKRL